MHNSTNEFGFGEVITVILAGSLMYGLITWVIEAQLGYWSEPWHIVISAIHMIAIALTLLLYVLVLRMVWDRSEGNDILLAISIVVVIASIGWFTIVMGALYQTMPNPVFGIWHNLLWDAPVTDLYIMLIAADLLLFAVLAVIWVSTVPRV